MSTNKRGIDPAIIAAIIGVMGTLCVTLVTIYVNRILPTDQPPPPTVVPQPTWTETPTLANTDTPVPTDTAPPGQPTSTPAPDTPTAESTFTPAPPAIGSDWANDCISVVWTPYPSSIPVSAREGCLAEPVDVFFATDGRLTFFINGRFENLEVHGLFAPLPSSGTASLQVFLRTLQEGQVWVGVFAQPDISSQGVVIVIPAGDVRARPLALKTMPGEVEVVQTEPFTRNPPVYDVLFEFGNGTVKPTVMGDTAFDALPVDSAQLWLFVGYRVEKGNNRIDAEFLNLFVQGQ